MMFSQRSEPTLHSNVKQTTTETRLAEHEPRSETGMIPMIKHALRFAFLWAWEKIYSR